MGYRRMSPRRSTIYFTDIHDQGSGRPIGRLANVSDEGLMLIAPDRIQPGKILDLRISLPQVVAGLTVIVCRAEVRWCHPDYNPEHWAVGMQFSGISVELARVIEILQDYHCFEHV